MKSFAAGDIKYFLWTIGCQMNKAESMQIASFFDSFGFIKSDSINEANLIILNTCVVRKSAEDKVIGMLGFVQGIKNTNPKAAVLITGCFVDSDIGNLQRKFPQVNLFFQPGSYESLLEYIYVTYGVKQNSDIANSTNGQRIVAYVPIILGCNNYCSYCIVPYRRGRERSRRQEEIVGEVNGLVRSGVKEIILLGQNVNSYGHDLPDHSSLSRLLKVLNEMDDLVRIRFLTNHPKDMDRELIKNISDLDKVCEHLHLPLQAGDNEILNSMKRGYTIEQYFDLVNSIRSAIPEISLSTDIIVGFPGETDLQFNRTKSILEEIQFDTVHVAAYSPREGTLAAREFDDNITVDIKKQRLVEIEKLQSQILSNINLRYMSKSVEILVEGNKKGKWYGRTRNDKLVFFKHPVDCTGKLLNIIIHKTSPWALQGELEGSVALCNHE